MIGAGASESDRDREIGLVLRFIVVGATGFVVDAGVLMLCMRFLGLDPISARFVSFAIAVVSTFLLNRAWAFRGQADPGFLHGLMLYLGVQGLGFGCNLVVYSLLIVAIPAPWNAPVACLAVASGIAMIVNYLGSRLLVFRSKPD